VIDWFHVLQGGLEFVETVQGHDALNWNTALKPRTTDANCILSMNCMYIARRVAGMALTLAHSHRHSHPTTGDTHAACDVPCPDLWYHMPMYRVIEHT
jgi:hypothetical protein